MMSNTKQQIEEMLNKVSEYNKLSGRGHGDLKDNCYTCGISPSGLVEAIDRLVTEARLAEVERIAKYAGAWMNPSSGERTFNWVNMEVINSRIAELQSQLTNKEEK